MCPEDFHSRGFEESIMKDKNKKIISKEIIFQVFIS
jgi:hypothetical protein